MFRERKVLVIDCQVAGISGDMVVGALLDLGADEAKVVEAIKSVKDFTSGCVCLEVTIEDVVRRGVHAKRVDIRAEENHEMPGLNLIENTVKCLDHLELSRKAKEFALNSVKTLVEAESKIHGEPAERVHLHEVGSIDTLADVVGTAAAADNLGIFNMKVHSTPVAVGGGVFKFSHGIVSSPAPATVEILRSKGFPMIGGPINSELATPTGVSLLVNLAERVTQFYPLMRVISTGYGAGARDFSELPNVLRMTIGETLDYKVLRDDIFVLETNVDDITGENIGYLIDKMLHEGAKDVSIIPIFSKKNRPAHIIKVLTDRSDVERLINMLIEETGTLGVRLYPCERRILAREIIPVQVSINGLETTVNVKVAKDNNGRIIRIKPEYEEIKALAEKTFMPLREIVRIVETNAIMLLRGKTD
ncbi:nickel pincer cofactor biosynthesis protein LarC [Candidatus Bathyarchaeota archaeon]|nr:nickel pincer cofactor biosynthesis protein LarC [Candidatus Bathyarchaeota archaeon]